MIRRRRVILGTSVALVALGCGFLACSWERLYWLWVSERILLEALVDERQVRGWYHVDRDTGGMSGPFEQYYVVEGRAYVHGLVIDDAFSHEVYWDANGKPLKEWNNIGPEVQLWTRPVNADLAPEAPAWVLDDELWDRQCRGSRVDLGSVIDDLGSYTRRGRVFNGIDLPADHSQRKRR